MDRRFYDGPMDWEYQNSVPVDPNSPFATLRRKNESHVSRANPFANLGSPSQVARPPPSSLFSTPRRPVDEEVESEVTSDDANLASGNKAARVKKNSKSRARSPSYSSRHPTSSTKRRKQVSKSLPRSSDIDKKPYFSDFSSSGSGDISESQRPGKRTAREATSFISAKEALRGRRENGWSPLALAFVVTLTAICFGGKFYYRVLSFSILAVWIYYTLMFSASHEFSPRKRQSLRLSSLFYTWLLDFTKFVGLLVLILWCVMISPIHIFVPTPMDAWTRYAEHPTFRSFEVLNDPGKSTVVEVFAIHGLGSNPSSAWRYGGNGSQVYWLTDLLPKQKGLENIKIIMLNHQTRWDSHSPEVDFDVFAKMMLDDIEHLHQV
ncbi:hypothetical protein FGADI_2099 [Fusarium gaditjirri]|uniref:Uncharacterized protein n=1 Tax=Fusarium gaditjirri TaxID=282569 RepID=A0A8H4TIV8_9HYPO|nr:hypothetical protein FGADI_2099 [Fusarium gaditjirri]